MARQIDVANGDLCDIRLLSKEEDKQQYMCSQCHHLAMNAKALICTENHEQDDTLYCGSCASVIQSNNQCPINQHQNPRFADQTAVQARIKRKLEFICLYSAQFNRNNAPYHAFVQDTSEGKQQEDQNSGCRWKGTHTQLKHHVKECKFKPRESKSLLDLRNKVRTLESNNIELNNKIRTMERTITTSANAMQELTQMRQAMDVLTNELSGIPRAPQPVQHPPVNARSLVSIAVAVFVMIAVNTYTKNADITKFKTDWMDRINAMNGTITRCAEYMNSNVPSPGSKDKSDDPVHDMRLFLNELNMRVIELEDHRYNYSMDEFNDSSYGMNWSINTLNMSVLELQNNMSRTANELKAVLDETMTTMDNIRQKCHDHESMNNNDMNGFDYYALYVSMQTLNLSMIELQDNMTTLTTALNELHSAYATVKSKLNAISEAEDLGNDKGLKTKLYELEDVAIEVDVIKTEPILSYEEDEEVDKESYTFIIFLLLLIIFFWYFLP
eukprot:989018_1